MSITCQVTSAAQEPLQGMLVTLECLEKPEHSFHSLTDGEGKITAWYSATGDWVFSGPFSRTADDEHSEWKLCFEIYRFADKGSAILSIPVTFYIKTELQRNIHLILDAYQPQSYLVLVEDSPLTLETQAAKSYHLRVPATDHNTASSPPPATENNEAWLSDFARDACTSPLIRKPGDGSPSNSTHSSSGNSAGVIVHALAPIPEERAEKEHEQSTEEAVRRLLRGTPPTGPCAGGVSVSENHPQHNHKAVHTTTTAVDRQSTEPPRKRRRQNDHAPRRSQRLMLRQMEIDGDYIPLE